MLIEGPKLHDRVKREIMVELLGARDFFSKTDQVAATMDDIETPKRKRTPTENPIWTSRRGSYFFQLSADICHVL